MDQYSFKAPWYGGVYERLIKSVKCCLKKTLRNAKVISAELYNLVIEIEGTLNNRPLTYLSADEFLKGTDTKSSDMQKKVRTTP